MISVEVVAMGERNIAAAMNTNDEMRTHMEGNKEVGMEVSRVGVGKKSGVITSTSEETMMDMEDNRAAEGMEDSRAVLGEKNVVIMSEETTMHMDNNRVEGTGANNKVEVMEANNKVEGMEVNKRVEGMEVNNSRVDMAKEAAWEAKEVAMTATAAAEAVVMGLKIVLAEVMAEEAINSKRVEDRVKALEAVSIPIKLPNMLSNTAAVTAVCSRLPCRP